jgi:hypothetical protein
MFLDKKAQIDPNTVIMADISPPMSPIDRSFSQIINKETSELNDTKYQMYLTDIHRVFCPTVHETFSKLDHILG